MPTILDEFEHRRKARIEPLNLTSHSLKRRLDITFDNNAFQIDNNSANKATSLTFPESCPKLPKLEPLPYLQKVQIKNQPSYIQEKNRRTFEKEKKLYAIDDSKSKSQRKQSLDNIQLRKAVLAKYEVNIPKTLSVLPKNKIETQLIFMDEYNGCRNLLEIIGVIRQNAWLGFFYMIPAVSKSSVQYHYYNLKVTNYQRIFKLDYCTISSIGVTRSTQGDEVDFTHLDVYEQEYKHFLAIHKIPTFQNFKRWKAFSVWRWTIRCEKIKNAKKTIENSLFLVNAPLRSALLSLRGMIYRIGDLSLTNFSHDETVTLDKFIEDHTLATTQISTKLNDFRYLVIDIIKCACRTNLLEGGFNPDFYPSRGLESDQTSTESVSDVESDIIETCENLCYTEQAEKREKCNRLARFICLSDYLIANALHTLTIKSVESIKDLFFDKIQQTPSDNAISNFTRTKEDVSKDLEEYFNMKEAEIQVDIRLVKKPKEDPIEFSPSFLVEMLLENGQIEFYPNLDTFQTAFVEIVESFKNTVISMENLLNDSSFYPFTRPYINNKFEEQHSRTGPNLKAIFDDDNYFQTIMLDTQESIDKGFSTAHKYGNTFEAYMLFYNTNENVGVELFQNAGKDVEFFASSLEKYHIESRMAASIVEKRALGLLLLDNSKFKTKLYPSPNRCLDYIHVVLPKKARSIVDQVLKDLNDAQFRLDLRPSDTADLVKSLLFLEEIQERIDPVEHETDIIRDIYELISKYSVPSPPEDHVIYQTVIPTINNVRNSIDKVSAEREDTIRKLCVSLDKDIAELFKEVKEIKKSVQNPSNLDPSGNKEEILSSLVAYNSRVLELQEKADLYKSHQMRFQIDVNTYEELEDLYDEINLKILLWNSIDEWEAIIREWIDLDINHCDMDELSLVTGKYFKIVTKLEKGLSPNLVTKNLKEKVSYIKTKLPILINLKNPAFKQRHWDMIDEIVNLDISSQVLTISSLEKLEVFEYEEEIKEVSGKASSEAALESMLKKIDDSWKHTEFYVPPYKDQRDVYVLGATDDIQQLLDDSIVGVSTILSSRNVGPIRSRVEELKRQFELFNSTLDEWLECQKSWMYLESIFSAPDIQRQLPEESKLFSKVDKSFKEIMRKTHRVPLAIRACTQAGLVDVFRDNNRMLEEIVKCLETYLETKRESFPRFYFLSNDELLDILAQTRNPIAVQPHLNKCFDAIKSLEFEHVETVLPSGETVVKFSNNILAINSAEGERVKLKKGLRVRGNVEDWLAKVEDAMFDSVKSHTKKSLLNYDRKPYNEWLTSWPSQVILSVSQIMWCSKITEILSTETAVEKMVEFEKDNVDQLNNLAAQVRQTNPELVQQIICTLITVNVHCRDIVNELVQQRITDGGDFLWLRQLRYYWDNDADECVVKMSISEYTYGYEYVGATSRLVITPLTDRCYLCLMGALQLDLGGAPAGPAGTGKTETTKDLAKTVAKHCVVFNCSDGLDYKTMGRFFTGLVQSGSWCCFDEFNRIDIEVLSVIAQQLITIRNAKAGKVERFRFEGRDVKLMPTCATFITMNPGYAGRTELPDNLKALFRPFSMMVPDYKLIAEVILYSEGFESSKNLSNKIVQLYKLCSEQLSQQDHYDFGMRALKSVLVMAGSLKRKNPKEDENLVLIKALRDGNLPKFLRKDAELFIDILLDLFPGVVTSEHDYGNFSDEIVSVCRKNNLEVIECQKKQIIQFYETLLVRHGVMLVGPTGGGKTTVYQTLAEVCGNLKGHPDYFFRPVETYVMNPKAISMEELYGGINPQTLEWRDGLMALTIRKAVASEGENHHWVVCDGPVDALWIENMNTVLDDNKMLCLANSERIKLTPHIHMLFEVEDLSVASPATVSRCGMLYIDSNDLGWLPWVERWLKSHKDRFCEAIYNYTLELFTKYVDEGVEFVSTKLSQIIPQCPLAKLISLCKLMESILFESNVNLKENSPKTLICVSTIFLFSYLWAIGGNILEKDCDAFDTFVRQTFEENGDVKIPAQGDLWSYYFDVESRKMEHWEKIIIPFHFEVDKPFFNMIVSNSDTVKYGYLLDKLISARKPVILVGKTGVGKSIIARNTLTSMMSPGNVVPLFVNFSAQTNSTSLQNIIEAKLEKHRRNVLGPSKGKHVVAFFDDVNMSKPDFYGSQPPIELLRQYQDFNGMYDRSALTWKWINDVTLAGACGPPGGGCHNMTNRFTRHFSVFNVHPPSDYNLKQIFQNILRGFMIEFPQQVKQAINSVISAAVEIYQKMRTELLPTPSKSHYLFNLRDIARCFQGIMQIKVNSATNEKLFYRLFYHEITRSFHDRLVSQEDKNFFFEILSEVSSTYFNQSLDRRSFFENPLIYADFINIGSDRSSWSYGQVTNTDKLISVLHEYQSEYNFKYSSKMSLIFFSDAIQHIARISRIIRQERGNGLLVGVNGTGKKCLARLAAFMYDYECFEIEVTGKYDYPAFREDLRRLYNIAGIANRNVVFLLSDNQIIMEEFLEDINNILNSGQVPNLFEDDDLEQIIMGCQPAGNALLCSQTGSPEDIASRDSVYELFIDRVRRNLHLVISLSSSGTKFRSRCRMFPSLVNCCIIDWFEEWKHDALYSVANSFMKRIDFSDNSLETKLSNLCIKIHTSVGKMAKRFYQEVQGYYCLNPVSYIELLTLFTSMLETTKNDLNRQYERIRNGLVKLLETNELVIDMEKKLKVLGPILKEKSIETEKLMDKLSEDQEKADISKKLVLEDEAVVKVKAEETKAIADDAQRDLREAMPMLEAAIKSLDALDKSDIAEIKVFKTPPELVQTVMEAVCVLFNVKKDWSSAKQLLSDSNFLRKLYDFDKENISEYTIKKLKKYIDNEHFTPEVIEKVSKACKSLCMWVRAIYVFSIVNKSVKPKKERLNAAEQDLKQVMSELRKKQDELKILQGHINELQNSYEASVTEKKNLESQKSTTSARLKRASKLTEALADEKEIWEHEIKLLEEKIADVVGNVFVCSSSVTYLGAFTYDYREILISKWLKAARKLEIPISNDYDLIDIFTTSYQVRNWTANKLPNNRVSIQNALLATKGRRWPLMIDPQEQANRWIRSMEEINSLKVTKLSDKYFLRTLESAIRIGSPLLIEDVGESIETTIYPILDNKITEESGRVFIRLGDKDVDYDKNFRLYLTTKLNNPAYQPDVFTRVAVINFKVTIGGLEDQLLSYVVELEKPELEQQRNELILKINSDKNQQKAITDRVLKLLYDSKGNVLDNSELITALNESKLKFTEISKRLKQAEITEREIGRARDVYRDVSKRGAILYFVIADMAKIDPMYQFSLKYFKQIFGNSISNCDVTGEINTRLASLVDNISYDAYLNVSRGLFAKHKLLYSFLFCMEIMRARDEISDQEMNVFLRGIPSNYKNDKPLPSEETKISQTLWDISCYMESNIQGFEDLAANIVEKNLFVTSGDLKIFLNIDDVDNSREETNLDSLTSFQKVLLIKMYRNDQLIYAISNFIKKNLGSKYIETKSMDIKTLFQDTSKTTPLLFVLSTGSDPMAAFQKFTVEKEMQARCQFLSLGQGQGPIAEKSIEAATKSGNWIFLQNCHLAKSWMASLECIIQNIQENPKHVDDSFRLFLSSMPASFFPVSVLQNSVKITNEPPKGIRGNLQRSFNDFSASFFEEHELGYKWRKLIYSLSFFHSIILERKRFGPLGWNIMYEFNDSDRECCLLNTNLFCKDNDIPWECLNYINGEITYGGRVTDAWDLRCLKVILDRFLNENIIEDNYHFSYSGIYDQPNGGLEEYKKFINSLPLNDHPEIFGMHENADISFQLQESNYLVQIAKSVKPHVAVKGSSRTSDDIVDELINSIKQQLFEKLSLEDIKKEIFAKNDKGRMNSLAIVLIQEIDKFNRLLSTIWKSLNDLQRAIKGLEVMSETLETCYTYLLNNQVPQVWEKVAYPSLKPLSSWIVDLRMRCEFFDFWIKRGNPRSFWIPGFFFPQGFLTGILQNYARKYELPIDTLSFDFYPLANYIDQSHLGMEVKRLKFGDTLSVENEIEEFEDGVVIHGLYTEGFRWDSSGKMAEMNYREMCSVMPAIHVLPKQNLVRDQSDYIAPLYKTTQRSGVLSTTGHSTNFIVGVNLKTDFNDSHWIQRGAALFCQLAD